jgi:hypothetical protein
MQVNMLMVVIDGFIVAMGAVQPLGDHPTAGKLSNSSINMAEIAFNHADIKVGWLVAGGRGIIIAA